MFNRNLISNRKSPPEKDLNNSKLDNNKNSLGNNKINIRRCNSHQSLFRVQTSRDNYEKNTSLVKVIPNLLQFQSIESHKNYEMSFIIRNDSSEIQKIRIIPPVKKEFKIKSHETFNNEIASGLSVKITVIFNCQKPVELIEDKLFVMGNSFKHEIALIAQSPKANFIYQKILNLGTLIVKRQRTIQVPIRNIGKKDGSIGIQDIITNEYLPNISYQNRSLLVPAGKTKSFQIIIKPIAVENLQLKMNFSIVESCIIKAVIVQDQVQLIEKNGSKISAKDFGELFVGEKVIWPFFISNGTENSIDCIMQTINCKKQNIEVKIDKKRNIFISQKSPQQFSQSVQSSCFSLQKKQLSIKPFQSTKNIIYVQKKPSNNEIQSFISNLTKNMQSTIYKAQHELEIKKNLSKFQDPNQLDKIMTGKTKNNSILNNNITQFSENDKLINETLAVKFSNQQKIIKIPIKFLSKIPNLQIDVNTFQFNKIHIKQTEVKQFVLKNYSNKKVTLTFNDLSSSFKDNFSIQGPQVLEGLSEQVFKVVFRPLIKKKFSQTLKINVFEFFPIQIKIFGECLGLDSNFMKNQFNLTMTDRKNESNKKQNWRSLFKDKTQRQITESFNQTLTHTMNKSLNKNKSLNSLLINPLKINKLKKLEKSEDEEIAKIIFNSRQDNMTDQKQLKQSLFFKKQDYLASTKRKHPFNQPKNSREISRYQSLTLQELKKIQISEKKLEFGHIFIGSQMSKKLTIKNKLQKSVLFEIDTLGFQVLKLNNYQIVKIQPYGTYEMDIILNPKQIGELELSLNYIINKQHIFEIKILAIVTLVNLQLSSRAFVFSFLEEDPSFQKEQILQIFNNGNKKTKFSFQPPSNQSFKVDILNGQLEPKSYINVKIIYAPYFGEESGEQRVDVEKLRLKVHEGAQNIIKCTGTVKQPRVSIKQTQFKFQNSLISVPITNKISFKNLSKVQTYIKLDFQPLNTKQKKQDFKSLFTSQTSIYTLNGEQKRQISFTFVCHEIKNVEGFVILIIRGYKILKIPFSVNVIYPQIATLTPQIDFGDVPIMGNYCIEMFSLINMTETQIKLEIDPTFPKDQYFCEILPVEKRNLQTNYEDEKFKTFLSTFSSVFKDNRPLSQRKSMVCNKILTLLPNGDENVFNVKFVPKMIKKYDVQLPIKVYGTLDRTIRPISLQVKCNAVEPEIYVEPRIIRFQTKVINEAKTSYSQNLYISNPHNYNVRFKVDSLAKNSQSFNKKSVSIPSTFNDKMKREEPVSSNSISGNQIFTFSQYEGEIQNNSKIQIFVLFKCVTEGNFFEKFNICLLSKGQKSQDTKSYQTALSSYVLDVSGTAIMPTLKFNCNEAIMPVVPLNVESRMFIMIENHGYDAITICKWKTSNHFPHTQIKVNFVEGKLLSLAKKSLKIEILFSSLASISFTTILQFYDEYGNKYELPLSCTADNSIFTSFPYIESDSQHSVLYSNEEKMIKLISTGKNSYYEQNKQISGNHAMSCSFIQKWLNFQLNMNIDSYPQTIVQSEGVEFVKLVNRMASKNIIKNFQLIEALNEPENQENSQSVVNQPKSVIPKGKISRILQLVDLYSDAIKRLKQQGAFLNQIRPQFLLTYSDYVNYQCFKQKLISSQSVFEVLSVESWITLFYQLCKIYISPQISDKIFAKMKAQSSIVSLYLTSNLYSNVEIMLIKFMNFYLLPEESKSKNQNSMVVSFTQQIKIFEVIQRVLENSFQLSLSQQISSLKGSVSTMSPHVFLSTIAKFLHGQLKEYGLSVYLSPTDLFTIGVKQLILYLINLVQMIYHYSNVSCVKFEGAIGDKITKVIELQNPTNKKVSYFVKIVNHQKFSTDKQTLKNTKISDSETKNLNVNNQTNSKTKQSSFIPEKNQITIQPRQKAQLNVVYHCRNAKGQTSNLYLIPYKQDDDFTIPQPLIFKLTTTILSKILMKKLILSTPLYEVLPIHLDVQLPSQLPESAQFTLTLFEQTPKQQSQSAISFNPPSFIFSQSHVRTLKQGNKDSLELKLVPLSIGEKICRISYFSVIYGEFIYQICAKVTPPKILKEIKMKELKVNVEQEVTLNIEKQNHLLYSLTKIYYPDLYNFQCRSDKNLAIQGTKRNIVSSSKLNFNLIEKNSPKDLRYEVEILDTQFVSLMKGSQFIEKLGNQNKICLKSLFTKPFKQYPVMLSIKNQLLKDRRLYKLIFVAISPPKIIQMQFKTTARQQIVQKIPIKLTPCDVSLKTKCQCFTVEHLQREYYTNTEVVCHFSPRWIQQKSAMIEIQNKESLQQLIYEISLKAQQPQSFGSYQLEGSSLFNEEISIPIDVQTVFLQPGEQNKSLFQNKPYMVNHYAKSIYFEVKKLFKRPHLIESEQFYPFINQKSIKSHTGIYTKPTQTPQNVNKQSIEKSKNPKARSMVDDKNMKTINLTLYPSDVESQTGSIKLFKPNTQEYYWAKVTIKNRNVEKLKQVIFEEKINMKKIESLQDLLRQMDIDFGAADFQYKFKKETSNLKFSMMQIDKKSSSSLKKYTFNSYGNRKTPVLVFNPIKETESENIFYFRANNKEYMLPIKLKCQPFPTIVVPQITTINIQPKLTYLNLINGTEQTGTYKVIIVGKNQLEKNDCFKFITDQESQKPLQKLNTSLLIKQKKSQDLNYTLKPKQKKQIKIAFVPKFIHQKEKLIIKFQSQTLPDYTYILNGRSQFKVQQEKAEFEIYQNHIKPFHVKFTNLFQRKEHFTIEFEPVQKDKQFKIESYVKIQDPINKKFQLEEGQTKVILISLPEEYFKLPLDHSKSQNENYESSGLKLLFNIRVGQKIVKKYELNLLIIKNLFPSVQKNNDEEIQFLKNAKCQEKQNQKIEKKYQGLKYKNEFTWSCKARQTVYENIEIPQELNFFVKQIKSALQISKYLTFTCISQEQKSSHQLERSQLNFLKLKFSPMKPIKKKTYDLILIGVKGQKYRIECDISVDQPPIDDTIVIKTSQIDQVGCVSFKLTNITKSSAKYKAYFVKKLPQFSLQIENGILEGYGKPGTPIIIKFKSHINNRRLQDKLILETEDMYWCFRVKGMLSKD